MPNELFSHLVVFHTSSFSIQIFLNKHVYTIYHRILLCH